MTKILFIVIMALLASTEMVSAMGCAHIRYGAGLLPDETEGLAPGCGVSIYCDALTY